MIKFAVCLNRHVFVMIHMYVHTIRVNSGLILSATVGPTCLVLTPVYFMSVV